MATIKKITVSTFKSMGTDETKIELGKLNCFIGANGVGKSNILEAIGVLGAAAFGVVDDESLIRRGVRPGVPKLYKSAFAHQDLRKDILLSAESTDEAVYRVTLNNPIDKPERQWRYKTETLNSKEENKVSYSPNSKNSYPYRGLAALKRVEIPADDAAAKLLEMLDNYCIYSPNTPCLRNVVADTSARAPVGLYGGQLANAWQDLQKEAKKNEKIEECLEEAMGLIDWIRDIDITNQANSILSPAIPTSQNIIRFEDKFMKKGRNQLTAYDASEGALYIMFIAVLCLHPSSPKVFAIDNLDQALNPILSKKLVSCMAKWLDVHQRQILFTTHNPAVLDGLNLQNSEICLFAVERNLRGVTQIKQILLNEKVRKLLSDYPLSRLWLLGELGAVPNV